MTETNEISTRNQENLPVPMEVKLGSGCTMPSACCWNWTMRSANSSGGGGGGQEGAGVGLRGG
jgi:streptolysin S family bacteriocin protoxin